MKKWCYFSSENFEGHYLKIAADLKNAGAENQFKYFETTTTDFPKHFEEALDANDLIVLAPVFMDQAPGLLKTTRVNFDRVTTTDCIRREEGRYVWPKNYTIDAMSLFLATECPEVGVNSPAFVIGSDGLARAIIAALVHSGFSEIVVTDIQKERLAKMVEDLKKVYFGVQFRLVPHEKITLLPTNAMLVVNTISVFADAAIYQELFYCNYLKKGGVVMDLNRYPLQTPLMKLSEGIAHKIFSGIHFWSYQEQVLLEDNFIKLDRGLLLENNKSFFEKIAVDESKLPTHS